MIAVPASLVPETVTLYTVPVSVEATVALKVKSAATALSVTLVSSTDTVGGVGRGIKFVGGTNPIWKVLVCPTTVPLMGMNSSPLSWLSVNPTTC